MYDSFGNLRKRFQWTPGEQIGNHFVKHPVCSLDLGFGDALLHVNVMLSAPPFAFALGASWRIASEPLRPGNDGGAFFWRKQTNQRDLEKPFSSTASQVLPETGKAWTKEQEPPFLHRLLLGLGSSRIVWSGRQDKHLGLPQNTRFPRKKTGPSSLQPVGVCLLSRDVSCAVASLNFREARPGKMDMPLKVRGKRLSSRFKDPVTLWSQPWNGQSMGNRSSSSLSTMNQEKSCHDEGYHRLP